MNLARFWGTVLAFALCAILGTRDVLADTLSVPFPQGFVGTRGANTGQSDGILNFSTLGVSKAYFIQTADSSVFGGTQGNDLSGTLRLTFLSGQMIDIAGAINWRITQGATLHYFGFIPAPGAATHVIGFGSGQTYTLDANSNYGLRKIGSAQNYADGTDVSGNASLSGLLTQLNDYLATVTASGPKITGPNGAAGATSSAQSVPEGQTAIATLTADRTVTWDILGGVDGSRFAIDAATGALTLLLAPDFEAPTDAGTNNTYIVTIQATDGDGYTALQTVTVTITDLDDKPPVITGAGAVSVPGGQSAVTGFSADEAVTWALGGPDAALFEVGPDGAVRFLAPPDHSAPLDAGADNIYQITLTATDASGNASTQSMAVTVTENPPPDTTPPWITGPADGVTLVEEGQTTVFTLGADEAAVWAVDGGDDAALFVIDPATGALTFATAPVHAAPGDADADNRYLVTVSATDAAGNRSVLSLTVSVSALPASDTSPPVITGPSAGAGAASSATTIPEGQILVTAMTANEAVVWSIIGGTDALLFQIDPQTGALRFGQAPDYSAPQDADGDNTYVVTLAATDAAENSAQQTVIVTVIDLTPADTAPPVITGPSGTGGVQSVVIDEGQALVTDFAASEPVVWSLGGTDAAQFTLDPATGELRYTGPSGSSTGQPVLDVTITATDAAGNATTVLLAVAVPAPRDHAAEILAEHGAAVAGIVRAVETGHLRASLATTQRMVASARDRFITAEARQDHCDERIKALPPMSVNQMAGGCSPADLHHDIPLAVQGHFQFGPGSLAASGSFYGQREYTGRRRLIFGDFSVLNDGAGVETASVTAHIAWERLMSDRLLLGYYIGGRYSRGTVTDTLSGTAEKLALSMGSYFVAEISDGLYLDGFLSVEASKNMLGLHNDSIQLRGPYMARSVLAGLALSGSVRGNGFELRPELAVAYGATRIGTVTLAATAPDVSEAISVPVGWVRYAKVRITPELRIPAFDDPDAAHFIVAPSLACDWADGERNCGGGIRLGLQGTSRNRAVDFDVMLSAEQIGKKTDYSARVNIAWRF